MNTISFNLSYLKNSKFDNKNVKVILTFNISINNDNNYLSLNFKSANENLNLCYLHFVLLDTTFIWFLKNFLRFIF